MLVVVFIDIELDSMPEFFRHVILIHIDIITFQASEPTLNNDVINPSSLPTIQGKLSTFVKKLYHSQFT